MAILSRYECFVFWRKLNCKEFSSASRRMFLTSLFSDEAAIKITTRMIVAVMQIFLQLIVISASTINLLPDSFNRPPLLFLSYMTASFPDTLGSGLPVFIEGINLYIIYY